jgi:hypothetical protein
VPTDWVRCETAVSPMSEMGHSVRFREVRCRVSFLQRRKCAEGRKRGDGTIRDTASLPLAPAMGVILSRTAGSTKEGPVSNSERRKTKVETPPMVSKSRRTRRPIEARLQGHPLRVNAADLPRRQFLHLYAMFMFDE